MGESIYVKSPTDEPQPTYQERSERQRLRCAPEQANKTRVVFSSRLYITPNGVILVYIMRAFRMKAFSEQRQCAVNLPTPTLAAMIEAATRNTVARRMLAALGEYHSTSSQRLRTHFMFVKSVLSAATNFEISAIRPG